MRKTLLVAGLGLSLTSVVGCTDDKDPTTNDTAADDTGATDEGTPDEGDPDEGTADEGTPDEGSSDADDTGSTDDTGTGPTGPTIADIQTHVIPTGEIVTLENVVVTASYTPNQAGFFISEPSGGANNGLWVYAPYMSDDLTVAPGDVITITGTTAEYAPSSDDEGDTGMTEAPDLPDSMTQTQLTIADPADVTVTGSGEIPALSPLTRLHCPPPKPRSSTRACSSPSRPPPLRPRTRAEHSRSWVARRLEICTSTLTMSDSATRSLASRASSIQRTESIARAHAPTPTSSVTPTLARHARLIPVLATLRAGDLVITELMPNPDACGDRDNAGEYIEVYNATGMTVDLNRLEPTDGGDHYGFVEESTVVGAGAYAVLQRRGDEYCYDAALAAAGAPTAVYRKKVSLNNTEDSITLSYGDVAFDSVSYTSDWPFSAGVSIEFSTDLLGESPTVANDSVESWCGSDGMIEGTTDMGSPGVANGDCTSLMGK